MNRTVSVCIAILGTVVGLRGQEVRPPKPFPPDIVDPTFTVKGVGDKIVTLSLSDVAKLPQQTVKAADHGIQTSFDGVLLADVLGKVDLPTGEKFHKTAVSYYLTVEGRDGYRAVYAWAELDPTFLDKPVYLVTKRDGKLLSDKDGPFQVVAPGEKRGARWVRQVMSLEIRQAN
jgi:hypothetical protein